MATIDSLNISILDMSPEELSKHIYNLRASRRTSKKKTRTSVVRVKTAKPKLDPLQVVKTLTNEQKLALAKLLLEG